MATLGLDIGDKRIGIAIADGKVAVPITVIESAGKESDVERIVVGLPRSLDGSTGKQAEKAIAFSEALSTQTDIPIDTWDERFSTASAERMLRDAGAKHNRRKANRDAMAAAIILQAYIDRVNL